MRYGDPTYGLTRHLPDVTLDQADARIRAALADRGFGVLTTIDIQATLEKKLSVQRPPYRILGACNPALAHRGLEAEPGLGLLLPCNVVVAEEDGGAVVSAIDPVAVFAVIDRPGIADLASEVRDLLAGALVAM